MTIDWLEGDPGLGPELLRFIEQPAPGSCWRDDALRRVGRLEGNTAVVKLFRAGSGANPLRERLRALARSGPAEREWRALRALHAAGAAVPRPIGLARLARGDRALVVAYVEGIPLGEALEAASARARRDLLVELGRALRQIHAQGFVHGDLHVGNVVVGARGPVILDLQRARRSTSVRAKRRDLARLDHSLAAFVSTAGRLRFRKAALGIAGLPSPGARARLRRAGRAADDRRWEHLQSRLRRTRRSGRAFERVSPAGASGVRSRALAPEALEQALAAHDAARDGTATGLLDRGERVSVCAIEAGSHRLVSKEVRAGGLLRAIADSIRGSPGRRAFEAAHGLRSLALGAPAPFAYCEWRRFGLPVRSLVLLEDLRPDVGADRVLEGEDPGDRDAALDALRRLVVKLHRSGIDHGDLKASHVLLRREGERLVPRLIDLEGVRFRRRLGEAARLHALAQLNASVTDAVATELRARWFALYARALRFSIPASRARAKIVAESLARRHRWSGAGCEPSPGAMRTWRVLGRGRRDADAPRRR